jgi:hypothetical protein
MRYEHDWPPGAILDPYVRLQAADDNATEVAAILPTLRELSRTFSLALFLVRYTRKSPGEAAGQAVRGSSDFLPGETPARLHGIDATARPSRSPAH